MAEDDVFSSIPSSPPVVNANPFDDPMTSGAMTSTSSGAPVTVVDPFDAPPERASANTIVAAPDQRPSAAVDVTDPYVLGFSSAATTTAGSPATEPAAASDSAAAPAAATAAVDASVAATEAPVKKQSISQPPLPTPPATKPAAPPTTASADTKTAAPSSAAAAYAAAAGVPAPAPGTNLPQKPTHKPTASLASVHHVASPQQRDDDDHEAEAAVGLLGSNAKRPMFSFKDGTSVSGGQPAPTNVPSTKQSVVGTLYGDAKTNRVYESIKVGDPELRGGSVMTQYHVYKVVATPNPGVDAVWRRYRDFDWLRAALVRWFPGVFVPPLPPKKAFGSTEAEFVKERKMDIERFLWRCAQIPALALSDPFTAFISKAQNFDDSMKELDKQVEARGVEEMIRAYKQLFPSQMSYTLAAAATVDAELAGLLEWLEAAEKKMTAALELTIAFDQTYATHVKHLSTLTTLLSGLDTAEKQWKPRPEPPRLDVSENFQSAVESSKQLMPCYHRDLVTAVRHELQDIHGMIELLKQRADTLKASTKAAATAKKWKQPDAPATNTDKLVKQKESDLKAEETLAASLEAQTKLIFSEQIKKFWLEKAISFRRAMANLAKTHSVVQHHLCQTWETLFDEANSPSL